jgi:hypothetical protein
MEKYSLLDMAQGAIKERVDLELTKIIDNIRDPNTSAVGPRTLTLTVKLTPDSEREHVNLGITAKSALQGANPIVTSLFIADDDAVFELMPQIPGQRAMDGTEAEEPIQLRIVR